MVLQEARTCRLLGIVVVGEISMRRNSLSFLMIDIFSLKELRAAARRAKK